MPRSDRADSPASARSLCSTILDLPCGYGGSSFYLISTNLGISTRAIALRKANSGYGGASFSCLNNNPAPPLSGKRQHLKQTKPMRVLLIGGTGVIDRIFSKETV